MMDAPLPIVSAIVGALVLLFGRKLFWLCVAAVGFAAGIELAPHFVREGTPLLQLTLALVLGFVGALLALFLQKLAIGVVGFAAGGRLAVALATSLGFLSASSYWIAFLIGGILGAALLVSLFDWALVFLSSVVGAYLVVSPFRLTPSAEMIGVIALTLVGLAVQLGFQRRSRRPIAG